MTSEEFATLCASVDAAYPKAPYQWGKNPHAMAWLEKMLEGMTFEQLAAALSLWVERSKDGPGPSELMGAAKAIAWLREVGS